MATFHHSVLHPPHGHALQNHVQVLPAAANDLFEGHLEAIPQPLGAIRPGRLQDLQQVDVAYYGVVDHHPLPLRDPPTPYVFPDERVAQDIPAQPAQGRPNPVGNQGQDLFPYDPQHSPPFPAQVALPDQNPIAHQIPPPGQLAVESLRRLAIRYLQHPDSQVDLVSMEPGPAGLCKVVIVLELTEIL